MTDKQLRIELSVAYVKFGGNTGHNNDTNCYQYFHAFNKTNIIHTEKKTKEIVITLLYDESEAKRFQIISCVFSNTSLFEDPTPDPDDDKQQIKITCNPAYENSMSHIIIMVLDTEKNITFCCDPQVINSLPPP